MRHMLHIKKVKFDVVLTPKEKYESLTESELQDIIISDRGCEWLCGGIRSIKIDGKKYLAANINWDKALENQLIAKIIGIEHFNSFYITKQGEWNGKDQLK